METFVGMLSVRAVLAKAVTIGVPDIYPRFGGCSTDVLCSQNPIPNFNHFDPGGSGVADKLQ